MCILNARGYSSTTDMHTRMARPMPVCSESNVNSPSHQYSWLINPWTYRTSHSVYDQYQQFVNNHDLATPAHTSTQYDGIGQTRSLGPLQNASQNGTIHSTLTSFPSTMNTLWQSPWQSQWPAHTSASYNSHQTETAGDTEGVWNFLHTDLQSLQYSSENDTYGSHSYSLTGSYQIPYSIPEHLSGPTELSRRRSCDSSSSASSFNAKSDDDSSIGSEIDHNRTSPSYSVRSSQPTGTPQSFPPFRSLVNQFSLRRFASEKKKKFQCSSCDKSFARPSALLVHRRSHTGEKPFACEVPGCSYSFSVKSNLQRHRKLHKRKKSSYLRTS